MHLLTLKLGVPTKKGQKNKKVKIAKEIQI